MLFVQSYDDQITHQMLSNSAGYSTCGTVSNLKTKQNYKNVTAYVTYSDPLSASVALIVLSHLSRPFTISAPVQKCCSAPSNTANSSCARQNAETITVFSCTCGTKRTK